MHDKNSREFLYYRKKVAEIKKEAQKLQTASQKGKWVEGVGDERFGGGVWTIAPLVESVFLEGAVAWGSTDILGLCLSWQPGLSRG